MDVTAMIAKALKDLAAFGQKEFDEIAYPFILAEVEKDVSSPFLAPILTQMLLPQVKTWVDAELTKFATGAPAVTA